MKIFHRMRGGVSAALLALALCLCISPAVATALEDTSVNLEDNAQQSLTSQSNDQTERVASQSNNQDAVKADVSQIQKAQGTAATNSTSTTTASTKTPVYKEGWKQSGSRWWYQNADGTYPKDCEKVIGGKTYRFDSAGWMRTGWVSQGSTWYYYAGSGAMTTGWQWVGGAWYYMASDGKMTTGWQTVSGKKYYMASSGAMKTGWLKDGGTWYYLNGSGAMTTGWQKVGGSWYYMDLEGKMLTGHFATYIDKNNPKSDFYFANSSGAMQSNCWQKNGSKWYYYGSSGARLKNTWISGMYWVGDNGAMATNTWVDNGRYYVDGDGKWVRGKTPTSSTPTTNSKPTEETAANQIMGTWLVTHVSTTGAGGLTSNPAPSRKDSISFRDDQGEKTFNLRLFANGDLSTYPGTWKHYKTENGTIYYQLYSNGVLTWFASISDGSLVLMSYDDTDYVLAFKKE